MYWKKPDGPRAKRWGVNRQNKIQLGPNEHHGTQRRPCYLSPAHIAN